MARAERSRESGEDAAWTLIAKDFDGFKDVATVAAVRRDAGAPADVARRSPR